MSDASGSTAAFVIQTITDSLDPSPDFVHHSLHVTGIGEVHYFFIDSLVD